MNDYCTNVLMVKSNAKEKVIHQNDAIYHSRLPPACLISKELSMPFKFKFTQPLLQFHQYVS